MKSLRLPKNRPILLSRSREGAWIEIRSDGTITQAGITVAPVRERGLKSAGEQQSAIIPGRSREGAWIEIAILPDDQMPLYYVAPVRERGLKYE